MSETPKKLFRIEHVRAGWDVLDEARHREIMAALDDLKLCSDRSIVHLAESESAEAEKLKSELRDIHQAILRTKRDIATIHDGSLKDRPGSHIADELAAIVGSTESATQAILQAAEEIDRAAADLAASPSGERQAEAAKDIQDQIVAIFETCNFQDLTGQRVTKVIDTFRFIEERVAQMMEIWGGLENLGAEAARTLDGPGETPPLNGPTPAGTPGVVSQNDIDAMFD